MKTTLILFAISILALAGCKKEEDYRPRLNVEYEVICENCDPSAKIAIDHTVYEYGKYGNHNLRFFNFTYYKSKKFSYAQPYEFVLALSAGIDGNVNPGIKLIANIWEEGNRLKASDTFYYAQGAKSVSAIFYP